MFCPQCGYTPVRGMACTGCGTLLPDAMPALQAQSLNPGTDSSTKPADEIEFYEAAIGLNGLDYYLTRFRSYDLQGEANAGWHWPAFFVTLWWMLYRKMWRSALVYFLAPYVVMLFTVAAMSLVGQTAGGMLGAVAFLAYFGWAVLWIPSHATGMYYQHCKARIAESKQASHNEQKQLHILAAKGGTSALIVVLILVFAALPVIGILAAIAIPQYAEYTTRGQMKAVQAYGSAAKEAIARHYYTTHRVPGTLEESAFNLSPPPMIGLVSIGKGGVLTLTMAGQPIAGKSLVYVPALDDQQRIVWECRGEDIPQRYLPPDCLRPW